MEQGELSPLEATIARVRPRVVAFVGLLLWWLMGWGAQGAEGWQRDLLTYLSPPTHVEGAIGGLLVTEDIVYFLTAIAGWLFLCHRVVESHRWR